MDREDSNKIPNSWATERLIIENSNVSEASALEDVARSCSYLNEYSGLRVLEKLDMTHCITNPELPPKGFRENHKMQTVRLRETGDVVGYLTCYHGYPAQDILWLGELYFHRKLQKQKFGIELIQTFTEEARKLQYFRSIQLNVHLKNWPAIRFWSASGFDRIVKYSGDKDYSTEKFASLVLEYNLQNHVAEGSLKNFDQTWRK